MILMHITVGNNGHLLVSKCLGKYRRRRRRRRRRRWGLTNTFNFFDTFGFAGGFEGHWETEDPEDPIQIEIYVCHVQLIEDILK